MSLVELAVNRISYSQSQNGAYALILEEIEGERKLPIVIGGFEAQSIAIALDKEIQPPRPLTHDLFKNLANNYEIIIKQVIIHKLIDGIFFSSIICERDKEEEIFDARTSDAIALALRFESPIYTYDKILDKAGIILKKEIRQKSSIPTLMLTAMSNPEDRLDGLEYGADDYMTKPFEPRELLLRIQNILKRHPKNLKKNTNATTAGRKNK